jgi:hypothetical protein
MKQGTSSGSACSTFKGQPFNKRPFKACKARKAVASSANITYPLPMCFPRRKGSKGKLGASRKVFVGCVGGKKVVGGGCHTQ